MVSTLESWVRRLVLDRAGGGDPAGGARAAGAPVPEPGVTRLVGTAEPVSRVLVVRPGTVAVVTGAGPEAALRFPGELLVPPLLTPGGPPVHARALSTAPVDLDVTVDDLVTFDGHPVERAVLRLTVLLDDGGDGYAALLELLADHPDDLEEWLLAAVHREVTAAVRGAVRMNRLADLQRLTLATVLEGRWLPARLGAGTLLRTGVRVQRVRWPGEDEPTVPVPVPAGDVPPLPDLPAGSG